MFAFNVRSAAAAVLIGFVSLSAPAMAGDKTTNTLLGAGIGAAGGALLSNGDTGTTLGGAAVGGLVGNLATQSHHHDNHNRHWNRGDRGGWDHNRNRHWQGNRNHGHWNNGRNDGHRWSHR